MYVYIMCTEAHVMYVMCMYVYVMYVYNYFHADSFHKKICES